MTQQSPLDTGRIKSIAQDNTMANQSSTADFAAELQLLRDVIPHARKCGAETTNISIELLARLLEMHDASKDAPAPAVQ